MKVNFKIISLLIITLAITGNDCIASTQDYSPYQVAFESYKTYDNSRSYLLGEDSISRPLLIHFWYPVLETEGHALNFKHYIDLIAQREDYEKSRSEIDAFSFNYVKAYSDHAKKHLGLDTSINAKDILDQRVYAKGGIPTQNIDTAFPLLIYAPSNGKASPQSHMLFEYLASHGYMVLSVASAGPNSIQRERFDKSTIAQVTDMEYMLDFVVDSLHIHYNKLGLFGFSSGGIANALFQMRNGNVDAILSLDGGQEYSEYMFLYEMKEFDLEKTNVPYASVVNNYENYSIYPMVHSVITPEKYLFRMSLLNHNGFISYWQFFASCSSIPNASKEVTSFEYLSEFSLGFFNKYLKADPATFDQKYLYGPENEYIQSVDLSFAHITALVQMMLDKDFHSADSMIAVHQEVFFEENGQIDILGRMIIDTPMAVWLYHKQLEYQPESWRAHYGLGYAYKSAGEMSLAKISLLKARELNPEHKEISELLKIINQAE
ncbi:hypothetical protein ACFLT1_01035 [Bacteroidota bacterium]